MNAEKRVLPPIYFLIALAVMIGLYFIFPIARGVPPPYNYLGVLPIVVGALMVIWAANFFSKVGTTIKPFKQSTQLVTRGLYKYTRNPMYLGMAFILTKFQKESLHFWLRNPYDLRRPDHYWFLAKTYSRKLVNWYCYMSWKDCAFFYYSVIHRVNPAEFHKNGRKSVTGHFWRWIRRI